VGEDYEPFVETHPVPPDENGCFGWPRACQHHDDLDCLQAETATPQKADCDHEYSGSDTQGWSPCIWCGEPAPTRENAEEGRA
jgi:hypothetical protein